MSPSLLQRLHQLSDAGKTHLLHASKHGIEKECLRVDTASRLAQTPHPSILGAALTHPHITTDYSEALLELITPTYTRIEDALGFLWQLHQETQQHLGDEMLWPSSMPCLLEGDSRIPIAQYGTSNMGRMKSVYRKGLWHRYGKTMQTIAGIHYNFSVTPELWQLLNEDDSLSPKCYISKGYFSLIRNFNRHAWLLMYLFGASPATDASFFADTKPHNLLKKHQHTLYLPYATSLRMSDLGYSNQAQAQVNICFNSVANYIDSMENAINTPYPDYERIDQQQGKHAQLNANILQIENEYYSTIRPKRTTASGQWPIDALRQQGVEYVEVRCLDLDPQMTMGINRQTGYFLDTFLIGCALANSPSIETMECRDIQHNFQTVVTKGREPNLKLHKQGKMIGLQSWGLELLDALKPVARALDAQNPYPNYQKALQAQADKLNNPELTPSAQVLQHLETQEFLDWHNQLAQHHQAQLADLSLAPGMQQYFTQLATQSHQHQAQLEASDQCSFEQFLQDYFDRSQSMQ